MDLNYLTKGYNGIIEIILNYLLLEGRKYDVYDRCKKHRRQALRNGKVWDKLHPESLAIVYLRQLPKVNKFWRDTVKKYLCKVLKTPMQIEKKLFKQYILYEGLEIRSTWVTYIKNIKMKEWKLVSMREELDTLERYKKNLRFVKN